MNKPMTETVAIPEFEAANADIKVELQFVPEAELQLTGGGRLKADEVAGVELPCPRRWEHAPLGIDDIGKR